jgi:hypothetical protein
MEIGGIISAIVIGLIIGVLGRLVLLQVVLAAVGVGLLSAMRSRSRAL